MKKGREESLRRFHPWVFSGAIAQITGNPAEGDMVDVYASDGTYMASGHYQIGSIAVRVLSFDSDVYSPDFWETMIRRALEKHEGRRKAAAAELGISERTLYRKIKELKIDK